MNKILAEFLGTFILVFAGTGAMVINQVTGGTIGHVGIALTFGLVVMAMIHAFGDVSGAHLNPAVSIAFSVAGRFPKNEVPGYVIAQLGGARAASATLKLLFPSVHNLGMTLPRDGIMQSFVLEIILTAILMLVIFSVSSGSKEKGITAGLTIGELMMKHLKQLDDVAYVRYASVYRDFRETEDFARFLGEEGLSDPSE